MSPPTKPPSPQSFLCAHVPPPTPILRLQALSSHIPPSPPPQHFRSGLPHPALRLGVPSTLQMRTLGSSAAVHPTESLLTGSDVSLLQAPGPLYSPDTGFSVLTGQGSWLQGTESSRTTWAGCRAGLRNRRGMDHSQDPSPNHTSGPDPGGQECNWL